MTKQRTTLLLLIISALFLVACNKKEVVESPYSGDYTFGGSKSMVDIMTALIDDVKSQGIDVNVNYESVGSLEGIEGVMAGKYSLAGSGRSLTQEEYLQVGSIPFAIGAAGIIVNTETAQIDNINLEELKAIYTGKITNWSQLGGADGEIALFSYPPEESYQIAFDEFALSNEPLAPYNNVVNSESDMLAQVSATPYALGYSHFPYHDLPPEVTLLSVNGVLPTKENVYAGSYYISLRLTLVTPEDLDPDSFEAYFASYVHSPRAQEIITRSGLLIPPEMAN